MLKCVSAYAINDLTSTTITRCASVNLDFFEVFSLTYHSPITIESLT